MATKTIGMQIDSLTGNFSLDLASSIEKNCKEKGYSLILYQGGKKMENPFQRQQQFIYKLISPKNIDSFIATTNNFVEIEHQVKSDAELRDTAVPKVCTTQTEEALPYITTQGWSQYHDLLIHMITVHHCKTFNIITGSRDNIDSAYRLDICLDTFAEHGITVGPERIFIGNFEEESGYYAMEYFTQNELLPVDCIISLNDDMAMGVMDFTESHQMLIPEDFMLIGFDDIARSSHNAITLSSVCSNIPLLGKTAADYAIQLADGKSLLDRSEIHGSVKYRKSCGCIPQDDYTTDFINDKGQTSLFPITVTKRLSSAYFSLKHDLFRMQEFMDNFYTPQTIRNVVPKLKSCLSKLNIRSCAVVLFERKIMMSTSTGYELPSRAELLFSYADSDFIMRHENAPADFTRFNPQNSMLPENTFPAGTRTLIVRSLYYDDYIYGYLVYEPDSELNPLLDTAFSMVSVMLSSALIYTEKTARESHQNSMLQQLQNSNVKLSVSSLTDELTKLYNRRGVMNFGQQTIDLAVEMEKQGLVFYADMDGLKSINDTYGHEAGDLAITTMGKLLRRTFRNQDIIGRMGGDEFVIVATGISTDFLPKIQERINTASQEWYEQTKPQFKLSISFGAIPFDAKHKDLEKLLTLADKLLYTEKIKKHTRSSIKEKIRE